MSLRNSGLLVAGVTIGISAAVGACSGTGGGLSGSGGQSAGHGSATGAGGDIFVGNGSGNPGCKNLQCQQVPCSGGAKTTVSGTVYTPKGDVPLYNVVVYIPNAPLDPIPNGSSCDKCGSTLSGEPIVTALTDTKGHFVLENVPVGPNIPLVIQVGKWRRQITLPNVVQCTSNVIGGSDQTHLPRNQKEGDIPKIALTTGGADPLECLLRKIGIEDSEFTPEAQSGRVNFFTGTGGATQYAPNLNGGAPFTNAQTVWGDVASLKKYDIVLLACEGNQNPGTKPPAALQALSDYASAGGRVFASHWHNYWLEAGPGQFPMVATWSAVPGNTPDPFTVLIDQSFPKGMAMAEWMLNVGGSAKFGEIVINEGRHTVDAANAPISRQWIYSTQPQGTQYFTFNTPIGVPVDQQCGRVVFSDLHVSSADIVGQPFPNGCVTQTLSAQEKALLFMLFDLSACISDDGKPPPPPH